MEMEDGKLSDYNHWVKIVILNVITLSLWASVAIGVSPCTCAGMVIRVHLQEW